MTSRQCRLLLWLSLAALIAAVVQAVTGIHDLVFWLTPLFLIVGLLLSDRYIGEDRLIALVALRRPARRRTVAPHWPHLIQLAFASQLERAALHLRGPPAALVAV